MSATLEATKVIRATSPGFGLDAEGNQYRRSCCTRCGGEGTIQGYYYVQAGVCFKCDGSGGFGEWESLPEWEARQEKRAVASQKRQEAKARKLQAEAAANLAAVLEAHGADLFEGLTEEAPFFVRDIRHKAERFGSISEAQAAAVRRALAPKAPASAEALVDVPAGRQLVSGKVLSVKGTDGPFGFVLKMTVQCAGFRLHGTVPSALAATVEAGQDVAFTATLEPKEPGFGFFSRPKA